jgi:DNA integrity scanning protein DisA with diadenylate cyclase activity
MTIFFTCSFKEKIIIKFHQQMKLIACIRKKRHTLFLRFVLSLKIHYVFCSLFKQINILHMFENFEMCYSLQFVMIVNLDKNLDERNKLMQTIESIVASNSFDIFKLNSNIRNLKCIFLHFRQIVLHFLFDLNNLFVNFFFRI